jgi:hypothetical protein
MNLAELGAKLAPYMPWLFALALLVTAPLAYWHWRVTHEEDEPIGGADVFNDLLQAGDKMTDAEFRRVRALMIGADAARAGSSRDRREAPHAADGPAFEPAPAPPTERPADAGPAPPPAG